MIHAIRGTPRLEPLAGMLAGALGGLVFWLAALLWPASIAVLLAMMAVALITGAADELGLAAAIAADAAPDGPDAVGAPGGSRRVTLGLLGLMFVLLTQYTALMALTAAKLPLPLPQNVALGLIMIAGQGASRALRVTMDAGRRAISGVDVAIALLIGFAPAALLGIPGLVGLAAAIVLRMALGAWLKRRGAGHGASAKPGVPTDYAGATQQLGALSFYLGALAAWTYI